jgi:hypothetical protein
MDHIADRCHRVLEPLHAMINFTPELQEAMTGIGLRPGRMCAMASRVAPMGAVTLGAVTGVFYTFNPELIARFVPRAWTLAAPRDIVAKRFEAAEASLRRLLGPETPELIELAGLVREAAANCGAGTGRPMYAAHAEAAWPDQPHLMLWHAATLLREYRGDGHVAILVNSGLEPLPALITHTATGGGFVEPAAKTLRGWSDEQWAEAVDDVKHAGLLHDDGTLTSQGVTLRRDLEDATNRLAERPWHAIGSAKADRIYELASTFSKQLVAAGAFPDGIFADPRFKETE